MEEDIIFRRAHFGGFNREDVIKFITEQKSVIAQLQKECAESALKTGKAEKEKQDFAEKLQECEKQLTEKNAEIEELKSDDCKKELESLNEQYQEKLFEISAKDKTIDGLQARVNELIAENERIKTQQSEFTKKEVESKIGNAMLDVRRYSDMILCEAQDKILEMEDNARNTTASTQARLNDITMGIRVFAEKFNAVISDVLSDAQALNGDIDSFNTYFEQPKKAIGEYSYEIKVDSND